MARCGEGMYDIERAKSALAMLSSVAHNGEDSDLAGINLVHFDPKYPVEPLVKTLKSSINSFIFYCPPRF